MAMDNDFNMSAELEQIRSEYAVLKRKLDGQEIINDRIMLDSVRSKIDVIESQERGLLVCCIAAMLLSPVCHLLFGASWWFCGATFLYMAYAVYRVLLNRRYFVADNRAGKDMLPVIKKIKYFRTEYANRLNTGLPLAVVWLVWLVWEVFRHAGGSQVVVYVLCGVIVGLAIAGAVLLNMRARVIRNCDAIIRQYGN